MITTSSAWAISGTRRCSSRDGRATIRNGNAANGGASCGYMAARSDHSRALPEGSASTRSTLFPACAKTWASQTADVVLPVPGLRLARAILNPVTWALSQRLEGFGSRAPHVGLRCTGRNCGLTKVDVPSGRRCPVRKRPMQARELAPGTHDTVKRPDPWSFAVLQ